MIKVSFVMLIALLVSSCSAPMALDTVKKVDLSRYAGKWYEVASFPQRFQKGCTCTTAEYTPKDGYVQVRNECHKDSITGKLKGITGKAFPVEGSNNAQLKVQFFWPFKGDYWVIDLDSTNYSYAVVGDPNREYLWILSRTPKMDKALYNRLVEKAKQKGFPVENLTITDQSCYF